MHDSSAKNAARIRASILVAALGAALPLYAAGDPLPPERSHGAVVYRSGGIGESESAAMKSAANRYPLEVSFAQRNESGAAVYDAGNRLSICDDSGRQVLSAVSEGPFLLARLPAGHDSLTASRNGDARTRKVTIVSHPHERILLAWKQSHVRDR